MPPFPLLLSVPSAPSLLLLQGCPANVVTYNTLIDVYGKSGQWEQALGVLEQMKREVRGLEQGLEFRVQVEEKQGSRRLVVVLTRSDWVLGAINLGGNEAREVWR